MTAASENDGSLTVPCDPRNSAGAAPPNDTDIRATIEIELVLDDPVPSDWNDAHALAARRQVLRDTATIAGEMLVHRAMVSARGVQQTAADIPVVATARAIEALHRALYRYRHDTLCLDGLLIAMNAMGGTAGAGVAAVATGLLERLRADLTERMLAIGPPRAD